MLRGARLYFSLAVIMTICFGNQVLAAVDDSGMTVSWGYKGNVGPSFWGRLHPRFSLCAEGKLQSPINISKNEIQTPNTLVLHYVSAPMVIMIDGTTDLTIGSNQYIINDGHTIQLNFNNDHLREFISYQGATYNLVQFHFRSPSENQINGESAPLEIQFVHQGKDGEVVIISVLVRGGGENPTLKKIIDHLPNADGKPYTINSEMINPTDLFPIDNDYYSFIGSLTTPPCIEGVHWIVMASTISASPGQIVTLRRAMGGSNARYVRPLHKRIISYSQVKRL